MYTNVKDIKPRTNITLAWIDVKFATRLLQAGLKSVA